MSDEDLAYWFDRLNDDLDEFPYFINNEEEQREMRNWFMNAIQCKWRFSNNSCFIKVHSNETLEIMYSFVSNKDLYGTI